VRKKKGFHGFEKAFEVASPRTKIQSRGERGGGKQNELKRKIGKEKKTLLGENRDSRLLWGYEVSIRKNVTF